MTADETKKALIDALIRLLGDKGAADLPVRAIAREAGVNHGLVHRYFGSKEQLLREAVEQVSAEVHRTHDPARGLAAHSFELFRERPELAAIVARACLDGPKDLLALAAPPPERLERFVAPIRRGLEARGLAGLVDAHVLNALGTAALLGWFVFRPLLADGYGLPEDADEKALGLMRMMDAFFG